MKKKAKRRQRILVMLLCLALCAADIIPAGMTVWASEQTPQEESVTNQKDADTGEDENAADEADHDAENQDAQDDEGNTEDQDSEPEIRGGVRK